MTDDNDDLEFDWVDGSEAERSASQQQTPRADLDEPAASAPARIAASRAGGHSGGGDAAAKRRAPARRGRPSAGRIWVRRAIALGALALAAFAAWFLISLFEPFAGAGAGAVSVNIPAGAGTSEIGAQLVADHIVASSFFFKIRVALDGDGSKFRPGIYDLRRGMSYSAALGVLTKPPALVQISVTIPEGFTRVQIAARAKADGLSGDYLAASRPSKGFNPQQYGASKDVHSLEGFLFPATYFAYRHGSVSHLVAQQLAAFQQNFDQLNFSHASAAHLSRYDVLIIASMIEREAEVPGDRPLVAAVIYNRLKDGMPLGVDATLRYALNDYTHPLTDSQLALDSPYNTRIHQGLPPTPISNPGVASMIAATDPAHVSYLYYVTKPYTCGKLAFATTNAQFQAESNAYHQALDANGGRAPTKCP